jgi:hypothetical protein
MKTILKIGSFKSNFLFLIFVFIANLMLSQIHAQNVTLPDSVNSIAQEEQGQKQKKDKKRKDEFKVFGGINFNLLSMDSELLKPTMAAGWLLGASYKRGRFFYWQIGATYNNSVYNLMDTTLIPGSLLNGVFSVRNIDVPITFGINFLTFVNRIVGLRVYVSAVPSFTLGVGDNKLGISMDHINAFNLYGQAGVGVDVAFLFVEAGYNYGFIDLFKNDVKSNPNQIFINLGFRF